MKRTGKMIAGLLLLAAALCTLWGCQFYAVEQAPAYQARYTLISGHSGDYWNAIAEGAQKEAEKYGVSLRCIRFSGNIPDAMLTQVNYAISTGVDGIIISGGGNQQIYDTLAQAMAQGIHVVYTDSLRKDADANAFVISDNIKAGQLAAEELVHITDGRAEVLVVRYNATAATQVQRLQGFESVIQEQPGMRIVTVIEDGGDEVALQRKLDNVLAEYPQIDAIYLAGASASEVLGRFPSLKGRLGKEIKVVSSDLNADIISYIQDGLYAATIAQQPQQMGAEAVTLLEACRLGGESQREIIYTNLVTVTRENLDAVNWGEGSAVAWDVY